MVSLEPVTAGNWRATLELAVESDQLRFVAGHRPIAALMLAKAYVRPGGESWDPYVIVAEGRPVGMLQHCYGADATGPSWLRHFFVDRTVQQGGIGWAALAAFIALVRRTRPACSEIRLTVHPENTRAQRLYERAGFVRTGELIDGEPEYAVRLAPEP